MSSENIKTKYVSGRTCCIRNCNISRRKNSSAKLFKFPSADLVFGQIWREKCQIPENDFNKNLYICDRHFESTFVGSRRLKADAVPTLYLDITEKESYDFPTPPCPQPESCSNCESNEKSAKFYRQKYYLLLKKFNRLKNSYKDRISKKNENKSLALASNINSLKHLSPEAKTLCNILLHSRPKQYSENQKNLTLNLYYVSPAAFNVMRDRFRFNLPHISTLYRWVPVKHLQPGFINSAQPFLKKKIDELDQKNLNHMVLIFDEMAIKKNLKYNQPLDLVDGFENTGKQRSSELGGQVCVFYLKALFVNWNIVFNYFISKNGLCADTLKDILLENLKILHNLGIKVRIIVCDQGSSNRRCFSLLGVHEETPHFAFEGNKIYCCYDFPHLLKSLRNGLMSCDLTTPDGIVSYKVLKELWEKEKDGRTKMCPKLTEKHIYPNAFEKMRVKYATQVFSHTVQAAIKTIADTVGFQKSTKEVALSTANFIEKVDKIFDSMNSGSLYSDNKYRSAIQINNTAHKCIEEFLTYLKGVKFCDPKKKVHFLNGMKLTLKSVLLLVDEILVENSDFFFIMTKNFNQDKLENTFAIVRQKGGNNSNPSVSELNHILAKIITSKIIRASSSANCEDSGEEIISEATIHANQAAVEGAFENLSNSDENCDIDVNNEIYSDMFLQDVFENSEIMNLELVSIRYFIGYVALKAMKKIKCDKCMVDLRKEDEVLSAPSELFIFYKNYNSVTDFGNLLAPSDVFMEVSKKHVIIFHKMFKNSPQQIGIKQNIVRCCKEATPDWFIDDCSEHREYILDFLILILLRKHCIWAIKKSGANKRKLQILNNN